MTFLQDLERGKTGEDKVSKLFQSWGYSIQKNNDYRYDLLCTKKNKSITLEIKTDYFAEKSGNIAIEGYNTERQSPSGIYSTEADYWVHVLQDSIWLAEVKTLRNFVDNVAPLRLLDSCGDKNARLFLYNKDVILLMVFHRIDDLFTDELEDTLSNVTT